jgi:hypothetical protein
MANIYDLADTWNDGATTFTGIGLNVTDTASASGSLLMDLQVGGSSQFKVSKDGAVYIKANAGGTAYIDALIGNTPNLRLTQSTGRRATLTPLDLTFTASAANADPAVLTVDAADTLAQRRSTNPQAFRVYNSYTDGSNFERGVVAWSGNDLKIGFESAGSGTNTRQLHFHSGGNPRLYINNNLQFYWTANDFILLSATSRIQFGGTTSSFPALKRSTTSLQARLADDSAFTNVQGKITTETAYTAGAPTATGYIVLYDSTGTAYKVPAEAL